MGNRRDLQYRQFRGCSPNQIAWNHQTNAGKTPPLGRTDLTFVADLEKTPQAAEALEQNGKTLYRVYRQGAHAADHSLKKRGFVFAYEELEGTIFPKASRKEISSGKKGRFR